MSQPLYNLPQITAVCVRRVNQEVKALRTMGWKRGQSGNPGGRPFGSEKAYTEALRIVSKEEIDDPNRPGERISKLRRMADVAFEKALAGENWAIQHIAERFEGRPAQMLEHAVPSNLPRRKLTYQIVHVTETGEQIEKEGAVVDVDYREIKTVNGNGHDHADNESNTANGNGDGRE
jgi:Family of unknown function (DUF5681)